MPRPCPLAMTGSDQASAQARAASAAPSSHTSDPSTRTGREACASRPATSLTTPGSGAAPAGRTATSPAAALLDQAGGAAWSYSASSDTSRNTGPRWGAAASRNASSTEPASCAVACSVQARLVTGASSGG